MTASELRKNYLEFFKAKGHTVIPSAPLTPANDPTVLFTTAGMHPLVPYLLGEVHPGGNRLVSVQKCIRTGDIDEVGDTVHLTFFEMLGNWSLGDYWKKEAIEWSYEFLTDKKWLGIDPRYLAVSVFAGDENSPQAPSLSKRGGGGVPRDDESAEIWRSLGIPDDRIAYLGRENNWWGPAGMTGPCGPDTEMFYWVGPGPAPQKFDASDARWVEIWNDVFMQYNKTMDGKFEELKRKNVDTGMGLERTSAVLQGKDNVYDTDLFLPMIEKIRELIKEPINPPAGEAGRHATGFLVRTERIIADHLKAATFMIADGVAPSNKDRGYVLRRLIRRAVRYGQALGIENEFSTEVAAVVIKEFGGVYPELKRHQERIVDELGKEDEKFRKTLTKGLKEFQKRLDLSVPSGHLPNDSSILPSPPIGGEGARRADEGAVVRPLPPPAAGPSLRLGRGMLKSQRPGEKGAGITGKDAFDLFQTYGFPLELTEELAAEKGVKIDKEQFEAEFRKHQDISRTATAGKFKGGLADHTEEVVRLHTATHLMQAALREVLGEHVFQKGSNITKERTRFDFTHDKKMTAEEIKKVEDLVNGWIARDMTMKKEIVPLAEARKLGAIGLFGEKYGEQVSIYTVFDSKSGEVISREFCGGPHVERTGTIGMFKIIKEEAVASGLRRIKAAVN